MAIVLIEHPYRVDDDGDTDEGLEEIEDLQDGSEGEMAAVVSHFFLCGFSLDIGGRLKILMSERSQL